MKRMILLILFLLFFISGCDKKLKIDEVEVNDLFHLEETTYIYFYRDSCSACERVKPNIMDYLNKKEEEKIPLVGCNLDVEENKVVLRPYLDQDGQGPNEHFYVDNAKSIEELYISATPSLILVTVDREVKLSFCAAGVASIREYLSSLEKIEES